MDTRDKGVLLSLLCALILDPIGASQCPEHRKPHVTSCTIFYNCVNLPEGGYVWVPARCTDGLVFQPYLRICVLPGDTWTCDDLATESSPTADRRYETPGAMDPPRTSYLGYASESSPFAARPPVGAASYPIDVVSELGNQRRDVTPYPLIEISNPDEKNDHKNNNKITESVAPVPQPIQRRLDNYLYQFFKSQQKIPSRFTASLSSPGQDGHTTWLQGFINRMLLYENTSGGSSNHRTLPQNSAASQTSTTCEPTGENTPNSEHLGNLNNEMLSYIVQSYILGTRQSDAKAKKKNKKATPTTTTTASLQAEENDEEIDSTSESSGQRPLDLLIDGPKAENNIVAIRGNLGVREYVTVAKYKSLAKEMQQQLVVIEILPCAKGIRLPNGTDCTRYYTCDPETAATVQFSCPSKTAFNDYNRVCEAQRYKACAKQLNASSSASKASEEDSSEANPSIRTEAPKVRTNPCQTTGKFADPESDGKYYVCYSSQGKSGGIDSIVMSCPNDLIFCQEKRLCTTRKRCFD